MVSIALHLFFKGKDPDYSRISSEVAHLKLDLTDLFDKVDHWRRRDSVRKAREKVEENRAEQEGAAPVQREKSELRSIAASRTLGRS